MPTLPPQARARVAAAAAAVVALGVTAIVLNADDYSAKTTAALADAGVSRSSGASRVTDLNSEPVEPGAVAVAHVSLPRGSRVTDVMPAAPFTIEAQNHTDHQGLPGQPGHTWYEITVRNNGPTALRFFAFISYDPATDGGL